MIKILPFSNEILKLFIIELIIKKADKIEVAQLTSAH